MRSSRLMAALLAALCVAAGGSPVAWAQATTPAAQLQRWQAAAGVPGDAERGQKLFVTRAGSGVNCASCHGSPPTSPSRHASTGKRIEPLAPAFNGERFADQAKADKWFRRNCKDVFSRECSAAEKADLMAYLLSLRQ